MEKNRKAATLFEILLALVLFLFLSDAIGVGCPIKFLTGISCPGCGMTRAWLAAFSLRFDLALAYHPLFWTVPPLFGLVLLRTRMDPRLLRGLMAVALLTFLVVWMVRLTTPQEANVLFSGLLQEDVVTVETPPWLKFLRMHSA